MGSSTGKDGIAGASFASKDITEESAKDLPAVQVGDPFQEKLLLEASLEIIKTGAVIGMQDMGAAGITCSTSEMSAKGQHGMDIWLDKVPTRQSGMHPFEILLSESQERMLVVVARGRESEVERIFDKWDLHCAQIGIVTEGNRLKYYMHNELVADIPADVLVLGGGAPVYEREYHEPAYFKRYQQFNIHSVTEPQELLPVMEFLAAHPNLASKRWVYEHYDSMVGTVNKTTNTASAAAVVNIKGHSKALAMSVDCNSRYVHADPETGCAIAVCEAARNIACSGGIASAVTNCLNFGNPYNPEVYWQFVSAIKGMGKACTALQTPVTGGNVSFYNQSSFEGPVFPTPTIGMIGLIENPKWHTGIAFKSQGDRIYLLGHLVNDIASSEYLYSYLGIKESPAPYFNLDEECRLHKALQQAIRQSLVQSAQDLSDGGLFLALLESGFAGFKGFCITLPQTVRTDAVLFGEAQGRCIVSVTPELQSAFESLMQTHGVPCFSLGEVTSDTQITINKTTYPSLDHFKSLYENALPDILNDVP